MQILIKQQENVDDGFGKIREFVEKNFNNISDEVQTFRQSIESKFREVEIMTREMDQKVREQNLI